MAWEKKGAADEQVAADEEERPKGMEGEDLGTLVVEGVVRGNRLSANRLMHVQGWGDFKISKVSPFRSFGMLAVD